VQGQYVYQIQPETPSIPIQDEPPADSLALFIEDVPIFKIWYAAPVEVSIACWTALVRISAWCRLTLFRVACRCFYFRMTSGGSSLCAPLIATQEQAERWANADSNGFMFLLIERDPKMIRQIRTPDITEDFGEELANASLSAQYPVDMQKVQRIIAGMDDQAVVNAARCGPITQRPISTNGQITFSSHVNGAIPLKGNVSALTTVDWRLTKPQAREERFECRLLSGAGAFSLT
jgi:hypothetical protein